MSGQYIDTPSTERVDATGISYAGPADFSFVQPFASPSKNPAEDLRNKMKGLRGGPKAQAIRTPQVRGALVDRRNVQGRPEFTPLLKSATRNRLREQSILEEKENAYNIPGTPPAGLRSSYIGQSPNRLPVDSSIFDRDITSTLADDDSTPIPRAQSSSMLDSTPIPEMPPRGQGTVLDSGNVLTLRDQEAKLDQLQKDNFGLKLRIHFLEETLHKSAPDNVRDTLKENIRLRTEHGTISVDLKKALRRLRDAEHEMEQYRLKFREYAESRLEQHTSQETREEMQRLEKMASEAQILARQRERDLEDARQQLEAAEQEPHDDANIQVLKDDIQDLEADVRDRERQMDEKDEQIEILREKLRLAEADKKDAEGYEQDLEDAEAELKQKDDELEVKNARIVDLEGCVNESYDREKSTKKLRGDVQQLEASLRERDQELDESRRRLSEFEKRIRSAEIEQSHELRRRDDKIDEVQGKLDERQRENQALQDRLSTARSSWDNEARETDVRIQEKDVQLREKEGRLREKLSIIEQRDEAIVQLEKRLRTAESSQGEMARKQSQLIKEQSQQLQELQEKNREANASTQARLNEKDGLIRSRENELQTLQSRIFALQSGENTEIRQKTEQIRSMELTLKQNEGTSKDLNNQIRALKAQLNAMETPTKKDLLIRQQAEHVRGLEKQIQQVEQDKDVELDELEQHLEKKEKENAGLRKTVEDLQSCANAAEKDRSMHGHQDEEIQRNKVDIQRLEGELTILREEYERAREQSSEQAQAHLKELHEARVQGNTRVMEAKRVGDARAAQLEARYKHEKDALEDEIVVLEATYEDAAVEKESLERRVEELEELLVIAKANGTSERERNELRLRLKTVENDNGDLQVRIVDLQTELEEALKWKSYGNTVQETNESRMKMRQLQHRLEILEAELRSARANDKTVLLSTELDVLKSKLREAELSASRLQSRINELEVDLDIAHQDRTLAEERKDLHDLLKRSKIEAEQLQIELSERDRRIAVASRREGELKGQLNAAERELEDLQTQLSQVETRLNVSSSKERDMRVQLRELQHTRAKLEDVEDQLGDRQGSSSGHARREAELRAKLRDAKSELDAAQVELIEKDEQLRLLTTRQREMREKLKRTKADSTQTLHGVDMQAQLDDADIELQTLQHQLLMRDNRLQASLKREEDVRSKLNNLRRAPQNERSLNGKSVEGQLEAVRRRHQAELRGLAKQIQFLRASCSREQGFRQDLVFIKKWFLMQVDMYNRCNDAQLNLLEDMGIKPSPEESFHEGKKSLRPVVWAVIAMNRMSKLQHEWAGNKKLHQSLMKKLVGMKKSAKGLE